MDDTKLHEGVGTLTYAKFGHLADKLSTAQKQHGRTYALLVAIKEGRVSLDQVTIIDGGWEVTPRTDDG